MVDIKTEISSKHRLRLIDSIKSMVITIKTTDLKRHRLYPTETHENRRQSTILPMKSFVWVGPPNRNFFIIHPRKKNLNQHNVEFDLSICHVLFPSFFE